MAAPWQLGVGLNVAARRARGRPLAPRDPLSVAPRHGGIALPDRRRNTLEARPPVVEQVGRDDDVVGVPDQQGAWHRANEA